MGNRDQAHRLIYMGAALCAALGLSTQASAQCQDDRVLIKGDWGQATFTVTVADDDAERATGLMNVPEMPMMTGMLFVYQEPQHARFWMRNTLIPLDMIFVDASGQIQSIHENAIPMDDSVIDGGTDISVVLEVNGGLTKRLGVSVGDLLQHPAFGDVAMLPCGS